MQLLSLAIFLPALALSAPTSQFARQSTTNLQPFTSGLAGILATPVLASGDAKRPFSVKGDTFVNIAAALARSCDQQFNACANAANGKKADITVQSCAAQKQQCDAADKGVQAGGNKNATAAASAAKDGKKDGKVGASCGGVVLPRGE